MYFDGGGVKTFFIFFFLGCTLTAKHTFFIVWEEHLTLCAKKLFEGIGDNVLGITIRDHSYTVRLLWVSSESQQMIEEEEEEEEEELLQQLW